jgi:hypothetical protein
LDDLCKFSSNFCKNWSVGNSLVVRDHLVLSVEGGGAVIVSKMAMCDQQNNQLKTGGCGRVKE